MARSKRSPHPQFKSTTEQVEAAVDYVRTAFERLADPHKAAVMAAYMRTDMPFYGVQKPDREPIVRELKRTFPPKDRAGYEAMVRALWQLPHREEKYVAIEYAIRHRRFIVSESLPLYEHMIRAGSWWDVVDPVATNLLGGILLRERAWLRPILDDWIRDEHMWIRRATILAHLKHKQATDQVQLLRHCLLLSGEHEFFIRKAIGWALREYSKTAPQAVAAFLRKHGQRLSRLSFREASRHLPRPAGE